MSVRMQTYAERLRENFPGSAAVFEGMANEEAGHRRRLIDLYRQRFGDHIPLIRRHDVSGFVTRKPRMADRAFWPRDSTENRRQRWKCEIPTLL